VLGAASLALPYEAPIEPKMRLLGTEGLTVALTLDACPGAFDERIATALVEHGIPATIFVTGAWIRRNPAGLAFLRAHPDIFAIENHGENHIPPVLGTRAIYGLRPAGDLDAVQREVADGAKSIRDATGITTTWYRAATGFYSPAALAAIKPRIAAYSLNADEGASLPAASVARRIAAARNGDVIVAHINQPHRPSGRGVADGARALQAKGAVFVHLENRATLAA